MLGALAGCTPSLSSIAPVGFVPADRAVVEAWVAELAPARARLYEIRPWRYRTERGSAAGRASIRIVPPDSLRFDYRGPFGKSGNAALVGDSALWVSEGEDFEGLITYAPLLWTALGLPPVPPDTVALYSLTGDDLRAWRYILAGDTLDVVLRGSPVRRLLAEMRRDGQVLGQATVEVDTLTGLASQSVIDFWDISRFEFTVESVDTLAVFDGTIWVQQ
jgi:hypothetical protein